MDLVLDVQDLDLVHQLECQKLIAARQIGLLQKLLRIRIGEGYVSSHHINQLL